MSKNIKSETIYRYDHVPGEEIKPEQEFHEKTSYREFDESGNLKLDMAYTRSGELTDKVEYRYGESGQLLETLVYGDEDELLERKEVIYGQSGKLEKELTHYMDGSIDIQEYFYNEKGELIRVLVKDDEDEIDYEELYYYKNDRIVKVERRGSANNLLFSQEDTFENDIISGRKIWSGEDEEPYTLVIEFNAAGRRARELRYNQLEELIERNTYDENDQGRVFCIVEENKARKNTTEFTYDEKGNVIHQIETDLNGDLNHEIHRTYDNEGNLLTTTVEAVMKPSGIVRAYTLVYKRERY